MVQSQSLNMHSEIIAPRIQPNGKDHPVSTSLGKFHTDPHSTEVWSTEVHQDSVHWISYQLLTAPTSKDQGQPTAWGSPLAVITQSTLLNFWSCSIHLEKESLRPSHLSWSLIVSGLVVFYFWGFKYIDLISTLQICVCAKVTWSLCSLDWTHNFPL